MDKEDFKTRAKNSIDELFAKIDELEAKKGGTFEKAKEEYEEMISQLKVKKDELQAKYRKLMDGSDDEWDDVKSAFSNASENLKEGFSKMANLFRKIADGTPETPSPSQPDKQSEEPGNRNNRKTDQPEFLSILRRGLKAPPEFYISFKLDLF